VEILATDVGKLALKTAEKGIYSGRSLSGVNEKQLAAHFTKVENKFHVKPRLKKMISFAPMNLASPVYVGRMDLIFCMNVLIYFTERAAATRWYSVFMRRWSRVDTFFWVIRNRFRRCR